MNNPAPKQATPFELIGGSAVTAAIVSRFYELMETDPAYAELRAIHAADLGPVREGLTAFLNAWLGGPKEWFDRGKCVMSLHRAFPITAQMGEQWSDAMGRAIAEQHEMDADLSAAMQIRLSQMAQAMVNVGEESNAA